MVKYPLMEVMHFMKNDIEIKSFIRKEMMRLDSVTGISTADSLIFLTDSYNLVGTYSAHTEPECFSFSRHFFSDADIDGNILIYIIRHEYAHCLNYRFYGKRGHGWWFKHCCEIIDCFPDESIYNYLRKRTQIYVLGKNDY